MATSVLQNDDTATRERKRVWLVGAALAVWAAITVIWGVQHLHPDLNVRPEQTLRQVGQDQQSATATPATIATSTTVASVPAVARFTPSVAPPNTSPASPAGGAVPSPVGLTARLNEIVTGTAFFVPGQARVSPQAAAKLDRLAAVLIASPGPMLQMNVLVPAGANPFGSLFLSQGRAYAIAGELSRRGVHPLRLLINSAVTFERSNQVPDGGIQFTRLGGAR